MHGTFSGATAFNQDIGNWNTSNVVKMEGMFRDASSFNQALTHNGNAWNLANVTNMVSMFSNANLSTANYNTFLYSQANNSDINSNITIEVSSKYSDVPSRNYLTGTKNWTITDNGLDANSVPGVNNISLDNNTIAENGGIGVITATINNSHSKDVSIPFAVGGTATLDTDYLIQSTLKGNASLYAGGNGIGSTNDKLNQPEGLALDSNGDLYISDYNNSRVQKVNNQTGTITTIVDSVTKPTDVHVDSNGNIFVLKENGDVMKFNNQGL